MSRCITIEGARVAYGSSVVMEDLDLSVTEGDFVVIVGPSGCGKSTLLRAIGELRPIEGSIMVGDQVPADAWSSIAYVFQQPRLLPWKTASGNISSAMRLRGVGGSKTARVDEALRQLRRVDLADAADRPAHLLSGGEQQRVAIARALALKPDVLLMDEPFSALDVATRRDLRREVVDIWNQTGVTIVFVTHDLDEAIEIGRRIVVFSDKPTRIVADIEPSGDAPRDKNDPEIHALRTRIAGLFARAESFDPEAESSRHRSPTPEPEGISR